MSIDKAYAKAPNHFIKRFGAFVFCAVALPQMQLLNNYLPSHAGVMVTTGAVYVPSAFFVVLTLTLSEFVLTFWYLSERFVLKIMYEPDCDKLKFISIELVFTLTSPFVTAVTESDLEEMRLMILIKSLLRVTPVTGARSIFCNVEGDVPLPGVR